MELLLDTCAFLWMISGDERLTENAAALIISPENDVYLSAASCWEIAVKYQLGKLELPQDPSDYLPAQRLAHGIEALAISESASLLTARLPMLHRDPFDRMLICQALDLGLSIVSPDRAFKKYPVKVVW